MILFRIFLGFCLLFGAFGQLQAHQVDSVEFEFQSDEKEWRLLGEMDIAFMLPETRGVPGAPPLSRSETIGASPELFARYREETEKTLRRLLRLTFEGKVLPWSISFPDFDKTPFDLPEEAGDIALLSVRITTPALPGPGVLRAHWDDDLDSEFFAVIETGEDPRLLTAPAKQSTMLLMVGASGETKAAETRLLAWIHTGFDHVLPKGLDHLFFILGLFLMLPKWRPLLGQSFLFTVAHSITLALSVLGLVNLPGTLIEILIAASITWIGIENLFVKQLGKKRLVIVFLFGLIHGCGFASVLGEKLGSVPKTHLTLPLLGFNIGVEVAQVTVLAIAFLVLWPLRRWTRQVQIAGSVIVALTGFFWMVQRILGA